MDCLADRLPRPLRRFVTAAHLALLAEFIVFGVVGVVGFLVDTFVVYATRRWMGLYLGGVLAYVAAVTTTWWLNRVWTFRDRGSDGHMARQWAAFVMASLPGLCLNLGSYFVLITVVPICALHPVIAIAAGAVAGMFANFTLSRTVVFR